MTTAMQIGETARARGDFCRCFKTGAAVFLHDDGIVAHSTYRNTLRAAYNVERIELKRPCLASALVRGNNRRARPGECVEHDVPAAREVLDGIDYERGRLHGGMHFEIGVAAGPPRIDAGVVPDIGSVPSVRSKFHRVHVRTGPHLVDEDQFVLGAIERSHKRLSRFRRSTVITTTSDSDFILTEEQPFRRTVLPLPLGSPSNLKQRLNSEFNS